MPRGCQGSRHQARSSWLSARLHAVVTGVLDRFGYVSPWSSIFQLDNHLVLRVVQHASQPPPAPAPHYSPVQPNSGQPRCSPVTGTSGRPACTQPPPAPAPHHSPVQPLVAGPAAALVADASALVRPCRPSRPCHAQLGLARAPQLFLVSRSVDQSILPSKQSQHRPCWQRMAVHLQGRRQLVAGAAGRPGASPPGRPWGTPEKTPKEGKNGARSCQPGAGARR